MDKPKLTDIGFSEGEAEIYLALSRKGSANISDLSKITGRHRTHIYDTIEKLKKKGMVSETIIDNKKFLIPSKPENILDFLKEKEDKAKKIINELEQSFNTVKEEVLVKTYKGKQGLKTVLRDIIKEGKDYVGYGEGTRFSQIFPIFYKQFRAQSEKLKIGMRLIVNKGVKIPQREKLTVKYHDLLSPSTTFIYSNKVVIIIWEPFPTAIEIIDKQTADSYKNYFELLWKVADKE